MAKGDGHSSDTAFKVASIREEYEILKVLGLRPDRQELIILKNKTYDLVEARTADGSVRKVWFRINVTSF